MEPNKTQFINDKVFKLTVNDGNQTPVPSEKNDLIKRRQSLQSLDELESDLSTNKYCTDADVLKALSVFSERASPVNKTGDTPQEGQVNARDSFVEKVSNQSDNNSMISLEYWSDEEGRYPPQMSISPPPCEMTFRKTTLSVNETKKYNDIQRYFKSNNDAKDLFRSSDDSTRTQSKRPLLRSLSPISSSKPSVHLDQLKYRTTPKVTESSTSQGITPSLLINSTENVAKSMRSTQAYNWKPRPPSDVAVSSPSLVRPILTTPPRARKNMHSNAMNYSHRMKEDKLFDAQRFSLPKRKVSRTQSSQPSTTKLFPEISSIAKTQSTSKSISDFRQSSSIFGKLVRKNTSREVENVSKEGNYDKQNKATDSSTAGSSRGKGETTRRKLRRILSLH
ncbi:uncharacterized protein LOC114516044 [Dendronephthya gigantea]|uniref:uncharacterized protein LOC114516044 n=1 Tax=Dendronephthya gigantea TaxID=151771 RepID=UPI00106A9B67|nr:uncharacterized protein LOC114516044 [Dendronephthya gigantea]